MTQPAASTPCSQGPDPWIDLIEEFDGDEPWDYLPGLQPAERKGRRRRAKRAPGTY
jgi:hypothetical protein